MRALAKPPSERYQSADEMDADLARVARGVAVSPETEEAATAIIAQPITAATVVKPPVAPPPPVYYDYEEPPERRRPFWPWLLALALVVLAGFAGWLAYDQIRNQLNSSNAAVERYIGMREPVARDAIVRAGLKAHIVRRASAAEPPTFVYDQDPSAGNKIPKGNTVTIYVSTGVAKVKVPDVRNKDSTDAAATIAAIGLNPDVHKVPSTKDPGTVVAQAPDPGTKVAKGSKVRINVSSGPALVTVPPVVGIPFAQASSVLEAKGFRVERVDKDSNEPVDTVLTQDPRANTDAPKGSTITLEVSNGPQTTAVPEVSSLDVDTAQSTLEQSGFKVKVVKQPTNDPSQEGIVFDQKPAPNTQAKPGSTVTIFVGEFTADTTTSP
jgi:serine/threonine-protein kinase